MREFRVQKALTLSVLAFQAGEAAVCCVSQRRKRNNRETQVWTAKFDSSYLKALTPSRRMSRGRKAILRKMLIHKVFRLLAKEYSLGSTCRVIVINDHGNLR